MGGGVTADHILVVNVYFAPHTYGGATVVAEEVAKSLVKNHGKRMTALSICQRTDLAPYALIKTEVAGIVNYLINVPAVRSAAEAYDNPHVTTQITTLLDAVRPDLVHVHCIQELGTGIFDAADAIGVPVVLSVHDFWWICERQFMQRIDQTYCAQDPVLIDGCKGCAQSFVAAKARRAHLAQTAMRAACVTYPSRFARDLSERSGFAPGNGVVWENGVHLPGPGFSSAQAARRKASDWIAFGYLGGPSHIKGWPMIKAAFAGLGRGDFDVFVVDGSMDGTWWQQADLRGLPGTWQVVPRFDQADMDQFYAQIDVLLFMSQWKETYGLAIREALARGIKVIQTDSGGTVEHQGPVETPHIPIGRNSKALTATLASILETVEREQEPVSVQSFDAQATAFCDLIQALPDRFRMRNHSHSVLLG